MTAERSIPEAAERIEYHGDGIYIVPSATTPGQNYTVNLNMDYCNCPATVQCWHIRVCKIRRAKIEEEINLMTEPEAAPEYPIIDPAFPAVDWPAMLDYYIALLDYVAGLERRKATLPHASTENKRELKRWETAIETYTQMTDGMRVMLRKGGLDVAAMEKARREETDKVIPESTGETSAEREKRHAEERARHERLGDEAYKGTNADKA